MSLIEFNENGVYCARAGVYVDPSKPVKKAIITHGHSDHARAGMGAYLCSETSGPIVKHRLGSGIKVQTIPWNEKIKINQVEFSLHPAGHIIGSSQVRISYKDEVWVITGDYKLEDDGLSEAFEPVKCHHFITECTFGLPIYKWAPQQEIFDEIVQWWSQNQKEDKVSVLTGYSLGKAQRLIHGLAGRVGTIYTHGAIENMNEALREAGIIIPETKYINDDINREEIKKGIVIAPPSALSSGWMKRFKASSTAVASGWMAVRGNRRRRGVDRGFVLSDHVDWKDLNQAVEWADPEVVYPTHGYTDVVSKWFLEKGREAKIVQTHFESKSEAGN